MLGYDLSRGLGGKLSQSAIGTAHNRIDDEVKNHHQLTIATRRSSQYPIPTTQY